MCARTHRIEKEWLRAGTNESYLSMEWCVRRIIIIISFRYQWRAQNICFGSLPPNIPSVNEIRTQDLPALIPSMAALGRRSLPKPFSARCRMSITKLL